ncbi:MAG: hypothetical protein OHK0024_23400 [Thalassobaculales bacterium]
MPLDERRRRLRHRARYTGMKENDLLLGGFADAELDGLSEAEVAEFEALLTVDDPTLYRWIIGDAPPDPAHDTGLLARIRAHIAARAG